MRKTFTKIAGCAALGLLMCFNSPAITKAAVKTVPAKNGVYNAKVDMNGDGKADAIKITTSKDKNDYINKIKVTMNKKTVYSKSLKDSTKSRNKEIPVMISPFKMGMVLMNPMAFRLRAFRL